MIVCKNCKRRHMGCHSKCKDYIKEVEENEEKKKERLRRTRAEVDYFKVRKKRNDSEWNN